MSKLTHLPSTIIVAAISMLVWSCGGGQSEKTQVKILGTVSGSENLQTILLEEITPNERFVVDSATVNNGEFLFSFAPDQPGFYLLSTGKNNFVTLLIDTTEQIIFSGNAKELGKNYSISGSIGSVLIKELEDRLLSVEEYLDSLQQNVADSQPSVQFALVKQKNDSLMYLAFERHRNYLQGFVVANQGSMAVIMALYQQVGRTPAFDPEVDIELFESADSILLQYYPRSVHAQTLHQNVMKYRKKITADELMNQQLALGAPAPEIVLPAPDGKIRTLKSLRGKYVLIDFWASWCKPCRMQSSFLVKLYTKYKEEGFEIFGVSLDQNKTAWENAIRDDKLDWIHVSDLGYWNSSVVKLYNIKSIPMMYLVGKDGKIIAKNLKGIALSNKLNEIFGF
ncbi:MAG: AhpC/TSA family protein [Bacteroidetes bacterium]|nr:AhpC/TSA family protein [Bacteroidota bacterium]MBU1720356.1 AhpC/TSA family protein [Bacteroidota bacterium]